MLRPITNAVRMPGHCIKRFISTLGFRDDDETRWPDKAAMWERKMAVQGMKALRILQRCIIHFYLSEWSIKALFRVLQHIMILSFPYLHHQHQLYTIPLHHPPNRTVCPIVCRSSTSQHPIPFAMNGKSGDEIFLFYFFSGGKSKRRRRRKEKYIWGYSVIITKSRSYFLWSFLSRILLHYIISLYD